MAQGPSAAAGVHFEVRVLAQAFELHEGTATTVLFQRFTLLGAAVRTPLPGARDQRLQRLRGGAGAQRLSEVDAVSGV